MGEKWVSLLGEASRETGLCRAAVTDLSELCSFSVWKWKGMLLGGL